LRSSDSSRKPSVKFFRIVEALLLEITSHAKFHSDLLSYFMLRSPQSQTFHCL
jgi:hypothetical protein